MRLFVRLIRKSWYLVTGAVIFLMMGTGVSLIWNTYISKIINCISNRQQVGANLIAMAALCLVLTMIWNYAGGLITGWTCETLNHNLRMGFSEYLLTMKLEETQHMSVGGQMSLLQNEISEISGYITANLSNLVNTVTAFIITVAFLFWKSPLLTVVCNLPVVLILLYVTISSRIIERLARKAQEQKQAMNGIVETMTGVTPVIHLYDCAGFLCNTYENSVEEWKEASIREEKIRARLMSCSALLSCIPLLLLLFVGGMMVIRGTLMLGTVYIFINLSKNVSGAMMNLPGLIANYRRFIVNLDRLEGKINL